MHRQHLGNSAEPHLEALAKVFTDQVSLSRVPIPEPDVFTGETTDFAGWKSAFEILIEQKGIPDSHLIYFLKHYLGGVSREAVPGYLQIPTAESFRSAKLVLEERFGNPFAVASAFRSRLDKWSKIQSRDGTALQKLADFLQQCEVASHTMPTLKVFSDELENRKILQKLPDWLVSK